MSAVLSRDSKMTQGQSRGSWESQIHFCPQPTRSSQIAWLWFFIGTVKMRYARQTKQSRKQSQSPLQHWRYPKILQFAWTKTAQSCFQLMLETSTGHCWVVVFQPPSGNKAIQPPVMFLGKDEYLFIALCHQKKIHPLPLCLSCLSSRILS